MGLDACAIGSSQNSILSSPEAASDLGKPHHHPLPTSLCHTKFMDFSGKSFLSLRDPMVDGQNFPFALQDCMMDTIIFKLNNELILFWLCGSWLLCRLSLTVASGD